MKSTGKLFSALTLSLILALSLLPALPVLAAAFVTLDVFSGLPGTVQVSGGGWSPGETVSVYLGSVSGAPAATAPAGSGGSFGPLAVPIPANTPPGPLSVIALGSVSGEPQLNSFYVQPYLPGITVAGGGNTPGSSLLIHGQGYAANETVRFTLNGADMGQTTADVGGAFSGTATVPFVPAGNYLVRAEGQSSRAESSAYFYVGGFYPGITPSAYYILPTQALNFTGSGFAPGETVQITVDGSQTPLGAITADSSGSFSSAGAVTIPLSLAGIRTFRLLGLTSQAQAQVEVTVGGFNPQVTPSAYFSLPGSTVAFSGTGFAPGETVKVSDIQSQAEMAQFAVDAEGSFTALGSFAIPFDWAPGGRTLRLSGQVGGGETDVTFVVGQFNSLVSPSAYLVVAGQDLTFSGDGFAAGETVRVTESGHPDVLANITADGNGSFAAAGAFTVPFAWADTSRSFKLTGQTSRTEAAVTITVAQFVPLATPSDYYLLPGSQISFFGSGFAALENITVTRAGEAAPLAEITADAGGGFQNAGSFAVPFAWSGQQTLVLAGQMSGATLEMLITASAFNPQISPSSFYVKPGESVTLSGTGFAANEPVNVSLAGGKTVAVTADAAGSFAAAGPFPAGQGGTTLHLAAAGVNSAAKAEVDVPVGGLYPEITPDQWYVPSGRNILFSGYGFAPEEDVILTGEGNTVMATILTDLAGAFTNLLVKTGFGGNRQSVYAFRGTMSGAAAEAAITMAGLQPYVSLNTYYAAPGTAVLLSGTGFAADEPVTITLGSATAYAAADEAGNVTAAPITIPFDATGTAVSVTALGDNSGASGSTFLTLAPFTPQVMPSTWYTAPGSNLTFTGSGFAPGEAVAVAIGNAAVAAVNADESGGFITEPIKIPFGSAAADFSFTGNISHGVATVPVSLAELHPGIALSTYYDPGGTPLTIHGFGFVSVEPVIIAFGGQTLGTALSDDAGNFTFNSVVPYLPSGDKTVQARGENSGAITSATFTNPPVYVDAQLGAYAGAPGAAVNFIGFGYLPGETVAITTDRTGAGVVHSFGVDAMGNFNDSGFTLPADFAEGLVTITISGERSFAPASIQYYVTGG